MMVADTSYIVEALLRNAGLFAGDTLLAPDLALYEVVNVIWKHHTLIRDLADASECLDVFERLVSAEAIVFVRPDSSLVREAYQLSAVHDVPFYDTIFIALALKLDIDLKTYDKTQMSIYLESRSATGNTAFPRETRGSLGK